ncbi:MAG TPA: Holliday junction resolvase RecU [Eubacterium sp.]|nr:Holliday junction resolvase RecU [Lachnospiraceae bacterium]HAZ90810.1 Holliday junction resolvase RecU [Eubacterium sp.]HBZ53720.1 Holliday junction resolvase RecU [Eubacterium sp.]
MATWNSRGLRGSVLEDLLNMTNQKYREKHLALVQKIPTPIKPMKKEGGQITLAYFEQDSTVDYIGVAQGVPICFDAKECSKDTFSLQNIHEHQFEFMKEFMEHDGVAFIILMFSHRNETYYIPFSDIDRFVRRSKEGGRKSFRYDEIDKSYRIESRGGFLIHYLEQLNKNLRSLDG